MITCIKCGIAKPHEDFPKNKANKNGLRGDCRKCYAEYMSKYRIANPDKVEANRESVRRRYAEGGGRRSYERHGLTTEDYNAMLAKYQGACWACRKRDATSVDHDHSCCPGAYGCEKCIRGLVCHNCNVSLGLMEDSVDQIQSLAAYLGHST